MLPTSQSRTPVPESSDLRLTDLGIGTRARVVSVTAADAKAPAELGRRLAELGFLPGEAVRVVAKGFDGAGPDCGADRHRHLCPAIVRGRLYPGVPGAAAASLRPMEALPNGPAPLVALVGNPNCGKTALFNVLTGSRQKVANYAGVTVEAQEGSLLTPSGRKRVRILDLPGAYSLDPLTPDEQVTADVLLGRRSGETQPDFVVCVTDATNLRQNLRLALSLKRLGLPMVVALNMTDIARRKGIVIDAESLARELGVPVVETVGVKTTGVRALIKVLDGTVIPAADDLPGRPPVGLRLKLIGP